MSKFTIDNSRLVKILFFAVILLTLTVVIQNADLQEQRKQTVAQAEICIKTTSDSIANYQLALIRQQQAHKKDIDKANTNIDFLLTEYNKLVDKSNKAGLTKREQLNAYSYLIQETAP